MIKILQIIAIVCLVVAFLPANAQTGVTGTGTFYIVRHAEKDTGRDPKLSAEGFIRAGDLYRILKNKKIGTIYTTKYLRTKMTGDSLRIYQHIDSVIYVADTTGEGFAKQLALHPGDHRNVLIIGHSNTIPAIIRKLGVDSFKGNELPETSFDQLYIVERKKKKVSYKNIQYGKSNSLIIR